MGLQVPSSDRSHTRLPVSVDPAKPPAILDGKVSGQCLPRHRQRELLRFLNELERQLPPDLDIHLVLDNYSRTRGRESRVGSNERRVTADFIFISSPPAVPGSTWSNAASGQSRVDAFVGGVFRSVEELEQAIYQYLSGYEKSPKPFKWVATAEAMIAKVESCKKVRDTGQ